MVPRARTAVTPSRRPRGNLVASQGWTHPGLRQGRWLTARVLLRTRSAAIRLSRHSRCRATGILPRGCGERGHERLLTGGAGHAGQLTAEPAPLGEVAAGISARMADSPWSVSMRGCRPGNSPGAPAPEQAWSTASCSGLKPESRVGAQVCRGDCGQEAPVTAMVAPEGHPQARSSCGVEEAGSRRRVQKARNSSSGSASRRRRSARGSVSTAAVFRSWTRRARASSSTSAAMWSMTAATRTANSRSLSATGCKMRSPVWGCRASLRPAWPELQAESR
jgi:hypothetical protein